MSKKQAQVGDTVILFPAIDDMDARFNGAHKIPALVTQAWDSSIVNLTAFPDQGWKVRPYNSIGHFHQVYPGGRATLAFWCWPEEVYTFEEKIISMGETFNEIGDRGEKAGSGA